MNHIKISCWTLIGTFITKLTKTCSDDIHGYNVLEIYNVLIQVRFTASKTEFDI